MWGMWANAIGQGLAARVRGAMAGPKRLLCLRAAAFLSKLIAFIGWIWHVLSAEQSSWTRRNCRFRRMRSGWGSRVLPRTVGSQDSQPLGPDTTQSTFDRKAWQSRSAFPRFHAGNGRRDLIPDELSPAHVCKDRYTGELVERTIERDECQRQPLWANCIRDASFRECIPQAQPTRTQAEATGPLSIVPLFPEYA